MMEGGNYWRKWYYMMSGKLVNIQNGDGSWNGHHCITSPVFCTATCLLILSIHNDMQFSMKQHLNTEEENSVVEIFFPVCYTGFFGFYQSDFAENSGENKSEHGN